MTLKAYLWGMRISWLVSLTAWILVFLRIDPERAGTSGLVLFYFSALLFLTSTFALMLTWIWGKLQKDEDLALAYVGLSFRQGALLAILTTLLLIFQQYRMLTWWDSALSVAGIFLIELYFLTKK
jgi:hypothetical protein